MNDLLPGKFMIERKYRIVNCTANPEDNGTIIALRSISAIDHENTVYHTEKGLCCKLVEVR